MPSTRSVKSSLKAKPVLRPGEFPDARHDHSKCVHTALDDAQAICEGRGVRLTEIRRAVLEQVWQSHTPVGAYDILERLNQQDRKAQPPTVYRALEFLMEQGLIHRIESQNAYIGCTHPGEAHAGQFLICRDCGVAAELADSGIETAIGRGAEAAGFAVEHPTVELEGVCAHCLRTHKNAKPKKASGHD